MKRFTAHRLPLRLAFAALFLPMGSIAQGVDFMYLADQYGQNMQNILHTEIMNDAGRQAMRQATGGRSGNRPTATLAWPKHITANSAASHIFTVEELAAMHSNDRDRTKQLLDGRTITVSGQVVIPERDKASSFRLKSLSGNGYDVWVYYGNGRRPASLKNGIRISIQGKAEAERRSYLTLRSPKVVTSSAPKNSAATRSNPGNNHTTEVDYGSLLFTRSAALTKKLNEQLATNLAPLLKRGNTKHVDHVEAEKVESARVLHRGGGPCPRNVLGAASRLEKTSEPHPVPVGAFADIAPPTECQ